MSSSGFVRRDGGLSTGDDTTIHEDSINAHDHDPLLEDDDLELGKERSAISPPLEAAAVAEPRRWYHSPAWLFCAVGLLCLVVIQNAVFFLESCGYESGFKTELAYLKPSIKLHRTRFTGAIRATADGNGLHVPEPALDAHGRRFTGPPSPAVDAAWHDLIYGRYVPFTPSEINVLNTDTGVPPLLPLSLTNQSGTDGQVLVPREGYYGGPDMLHSLHCLNGLRKHLRLDYYGASMPTLPTEYERMHIDHCLEQLRQAVLCHGDMTPVTLRPVRNERGHVWALLGETEREHTCRDGEALGSAWRERAGEGERVESE
ncbi:hypothetical protein B0A55_03276 [Friedmanniomyces simplex]|uniref:Tat pathway signal sequence n=1 Tax=Friedmanniomyces simplex TaxID=329884 RepID=A0A4U0XSX6_9PEZI|nr:hypothetical protein B0A55_03276 [Friedmanniomyces simplex]